MNSDTIQLITVFTPTYNRENLLPRLYKSLREQTSYNFIWMIIDDGSTDNTEQLVKSWIENNNEFPIEYYKKENGGLQSGYVEAIKHIKTELAMCIDSDDKALPDAIQSIQELWDRSDKQSYAGIYGLDSYENGEVVGGFFDSDTSEVNIINFDSKKKSRINYDRTLVIRTDLYRKTKPAKTYPNERTMNATYLHLQISLEYNFLVLNKPLVVIEYQSDGLSQSKKKHYLSAPNTYADWRMFLLGLDDAPISFYYKTAIHYVSSCILAKRKIMTKECHHKVIVFFSIPFGLLLSIYLRKRVS